MEHTFAIPVYGAAPNLPALIESLRAQVDVGSEIVLASSTPSAGLDSLAAHYALPLYINSNRIDIATDWNFALSVAGTRFVTLAHQDDWFAPTYAAQVLAALKRHPQALFAFCDYSEHTSRGPRPANVNLYVKRFLRWRAFRAREFINQPADMKRLLSLGNPICCPSVMFNRSTLGDFKFPNGFQTNLDWMAWLELAGRPGGIAHVSGPLVSKGVHLESETTVTIASRARKREDRAIFDAIWPAPMAAVLAKLYTLGYRANRT
jgi:glycosyltransferase involved in cell wall biosynthesis